MTAEQDHPYIVINGGSRNEVAIPVLKSNLSIGRDQDADILIDDPTVSRKHAEIVRTRDGFMLVDLGSKNGSFVNGIEISRMGQNLKNGDEIRFGPGHITMIFRESNSSERSIQEPPVTESVILRGGHPGRPGKVERPGDALEDELLSGAVRIRAVAEGNPQDLNRWVGRLQNKAHIHMLRAVSISANEMEIMLTVLEPLALVRVLSDLGGVASVKSGDGGIKGISEDEPRAFTVVLSG